MSEGKGGERKSKALCDALPAIDARRFLARACAKDSALRKDVQAKADSMRSETVAAAARAVRRAAERGVPRTRAWRIAQLRACQRMLIEGRDKFAAEFKKDFNRSPFGSYSLELGQIEQSIQSALDKLDSWMAPRPVPGNLVVTPGKSAVRPEPFGAVLIIGCWNYPFKLSLDPLVGAIAAGNSVLLKMPSDMVPNASRAVVELCAQYLDRDAIRVIGGGVRENTALLQEKWDKIFYTGSDFVGRIVYQAAADRLTPVTLEMGGKCPTVIGRSSNLSLAAKRVAWAKWTNAGQTCVSPDYVCVHEDIAERFLRELEANIESFYEGDPAASVEYCRMVNERHARRVSAFITANKGEVRFGGKFDVSKRYIEPTVLFFGGNWDKFGSSKVMSEEIFGPVLPVVTFSDRKTVIPFINQGIGKPLALYVYSSDRNEYEDILQNTSSGAAVVNDSIVQMTNHALPFGGVGSSGIGRYHGKYTFDCFSHEKAVLVRPGISLLDVPARYPPYSGWKQTVLKLATRATPAWQVKAIKMGIAVLLIAAVWKNRRGARGVLHWLVDLLLGG